MNWAIAPRISGPLLEWHHDAAVGIGMFALHEHGEPVVYAREGGANAIQRPKRIAQIHLTESPVTLAT